MGQTQHLDYYGEVAAGNIAGRSILRALGEREGMGTTASGEDIWRGSAVVVPTPPNAGEVMFIVSSDAADTLAGTGIQTMQVEYLKEDGTEATVVVDMNGTTPVQLPYATIRFIQDMHAETVGTGGVAAGNITIYKTGAASTIYCMVALGGNRSMVPHRMVPIGKTLTAVKWQCSEANNKRAAIRIRSTDMHGVLKPGVFCFKDVCYLNQSSSGPLDLSVNIPALSIVKISAWAVAANAEVGCSWWGVLIDD